MLKFYLWITKWKPCTYDNKIGPHLDLANKQIHTNKPSIPKYLIRFNDLLSCEKAPSND